MIKKILIFTLMLLLPLTLTNTAHAFEVTTNFSGEFLEIKSDVIDIPAGTEIISMYMPPLGIITDEVIVALKVWRSQFVFYNSNGTINNEIYFSDLDDVIGLQLSGELKFDLTELVLDYPNIDDAVSFQLQLIIGHNDLTTYPYGYGVYLAEWFNTYFDYDFDADVTIPNLGDHIIRYYSLGRLYFTQESTLTPFAPPNPHRDNFNFDGWYTITGDLYEFDEPLPNPNHPLPININLYARWKASENIPPVVDPSQVNIPTAIMNALGMIGMNTVGGRTIVYFVITLIVTISLLFLKMNAIVIITINFILTSVFMFIGWFPIYLIIMLTGSLLVGFVLALKGGI